MDAVTAAALADALQTAIASGVLTVRHGDTMTTFRSIDEMQRVLADLQRTAGVSHARVRYTYQLRKGF